MSNEKDYYYDIAIQIWEDEGGNVVYSVIQSFSEKEDDCEVIAYGEVATAEEAIKNAREAVNSVLE
jgi:hypothetical protein